MNLEQAYQIYDLLIDQLEAPASLKDNFAFCVTEERVKEYRFQGLLGFGGKYRPESNKVDCYPEDATRKRMSLIRKTNKMLADLLYK